MQNAQLLISFPHWGHLHSLHFEQVLLHFLSCKVMMGMLVNGHYKTYDDPNKVIQIDGEQSKN